jgi:uncharacterized membrane protein YgcG
MASFHSAPLTKALTLSFPISHFVLTSLSSSRTPGYLNLATSSPLSLLLSPLAFPSLTSSLLAAGLFYHTSRPVERALSTAKYSACLLLSLAMGATWQLLTMATLPSVLLSGGPFLPVFASVALYGALVPTLHSDFATVLGIKFSEKAMTYLTAVVLATGDGWSSALPAALGYLAGRTYAAEPFHFLRQLCVPQPLARATHELVGWLLEEQAPGAQPGGGRGGRNPNRGRGGGGRGGGGGEGGGGGGGGASEVEQQRMAMEQFAAQLRQQRGAPPPAPLQAPAPVFEPAPEAPPPSEEAIATLVGMGFERVAVIQALGGCDNNVEVAANRLMG